MILELIIYVPHLLGILQIWPATSILLELLVFPKLIVLCTAGMYTAINIFYGFLTSIGTVDGISYNLQIYYYKYTCAHESTCKIVTARPAKKAELLFNSGVIL